MVKRLKKLSDEVVHESPWARYVHDQYEKPDGTTGDYFYVDCRDGVMIIPVLPDGRIVLTLQYRYLAEKQSIEFPSGAMEEDAADALHAAKDELKEETGCVAEDLIKIGLFEPSPGYQKQMLHLFLARVDQMAEQDVDDTEEIDVLVRTPADIDRMVQNNEITNGLTLAAWALARHHVMKVEEYHLNDPFVAKIEKNL